MAIVIATDVFCDGGGEGCLFWVNGQTGAKVKIKAARASAKRKGWVYSRAGDFCPVCKSGAA